MWWCGGTGLFGTRPLLLGRSHRRCALRLGSLPWRGLSSEGLVSLGENSTTPFDVGSTRWSEFRRREEKIDDVDAKIYPRLRKSMNLFGLEGVGVVVWWKWSS